MKNYINNSNTENSNRPMFRDCKHIHNQSMSLAGERLSFLDDIELGDVDIFIESGDTRRKVRRIIEKRVAQRMHRKGKCYFDNYTRYNSKRRVANHFKNIFGESPTHFAA